jgi:hypothetical protein
MEAGHRCCDYDIAPSFDGTYSTTGAGGKRPRPVKDQVSRAFSATPALWIQLFKLDCVPTAGKHVAQDPTLIAPSALGGLSRPFTGLTPATDLQRCDHVVSSTRCAVHYSGPRCTGNWGVDNTTLRHILIQVDLDTGAVSQACGRLPKMVPAVVHGPNGLPYGYGMVGNTAINNGFGLIQPMPASIARSSA